MVFLLLEWMESCSEAVIIIFSAHLHRCCRDTQQMRCVTPSPSQWNYTHICVCASLKLKGTWLLACVSIEKLFVHKNVFAHSVYCANAMLCKLWYSRFCAELPLRGCIMHGNRAALSAVIKRIHVWVAVSRSTLGMIIWAGALTFLPDCALFLWLGRVACSVFIQADQKHHLLTRTTPL